MLDEDVSSDEIRGMFTLKKAQIEQTVRTELTRLRHVESRLKQIDEGEIVGSFEVIVKSVPEQAYLSLANPLHQFQQQLIFGGPLTLSLLCLVIRLPTDAKPVAGGPLADLTISCGLAYDFFPKFF